MVAGWQQFSLALHAATLHLGDLDAADSDCESATDDAEAPPVASCEDGVDDDGDGWTDAADPDCAEASSVEAGLGATMCNDGVDNDADGATDGGDADCVDALQDEAPEGR